MNIRKFINQLIGSVKRQIDNYVNEHDKIDINLLVCKGGVIGA